MSKASGVINGNDEGQSSQGIDTRNGHHSPDSLIALCHCQELLIIFVDLLGQTGLGKEQRHEKQRARRRLCEPDCMDDY